MPALNCPVTSCAYKTEDVAATVGLELLKMHERIEHPSTTSTNSRAPKIERPTIAGSSSEEAWNTFNTKWEMFKNTYELTGEGAVQQLFYCCEVELGDAILKSNSEAVKGTEAELLELIKNLRQNVSSLPFRNLFDFHIYTFFKVKFIFVLCGLFVSHVLYLVPNLRSK